jgi:hypothetical protein
MALAVDRWKDSPHAEREVLRRALEIEEFGHQLFFISNAAE